MMFIFQRRELLVTYDFTQYDCVKQRLQAAGIAYRTQIGGFGGVEHARHWRGAVGVDANRAVDYHIYVYRKDYDAAVQCMQQC